MLLVLVYIYKSKGTTDIVFMTTLQKNAAKVKILKQSTYTKLLKKIFQLTDKNLNGRSLGWMPVKMAISAVIATPYQRHQVAHMKPDLDKPL